METTVRGIVLRRKDTGESDRRLTLFSEELGKIDVVAKGARNASSRLRGSSEPLSVATFTFHDGKKQRFVTQAQPHSAFRGLRSDFDRISMGIAFAELLAAVLPYEEPFPEAFELCEQSLTLLESHPKPLVSLIWSELKLLELAGFSPCFAESVVSGTKVQEAEAFVSPRAGGYVTDGESHEFADRFLTRAEVLYGLAAMAQQEVPPPSLKHAMGCLTTLFPFWRHVAESALPANEALIAQLAQAQAIQSSATGVQSPNA